MKGANKNIKDMGTTDAVNSTIGMDKADEKCRWVIAVVHNNTELSSRDKLLDLGYEAYVPSQEEVRVWRNGRKKKVERLFFKNWVFLHVTEDQRKQAVNTPMVKEYYKNRVKTPSADCPVLVIPDDQMERMRFILRHAPSPVEISDRIFRKGDEIKVTRGSLAGLKGFVSEDSDGKSALIVELGILGSAKVQIDVTDIE